MIFFEIIRNKGSYNKMKCDSQHTTKDLKKDKTGSWNS
jgi:hypothetical protein